LREPEPAEVRQRDLVARPRDGGPEVQAQRDRAVDDGRQHVGEKQELGAGADRPGALLGLRALVRQTQDPLGRHRCRGMEGDDAPGLEVLIDDQEARSGAEAVEERVPQAGAAP
jgi:hypothetical protein